MNLLKISGKLMFKEYILAKVIVFHQEVIVFHIYFTIDSIKMIQIIQLMIQIVFIKKVSKLENRIFLTITITIKHHLESIYIQIFFGQVGLVMQNLKIVDMNLFKLF